MDFSTSSNAKIQNNVEGLMRENTIHMQRKNCGCRNVEEKQLLDHMGRWGYDWGCRLKDQSRANINNMEIGLDQWHMLNPMELYTDYGREVGGEEV